jgi:hypothetical protein
MRWGRKDTANYLVVFTIFFLINLVTTGGHLDMWDGVVTFMITESMALKKTAQLHPEIPTISSANPNDIVNTMQEYEIGNYKAVTGKYHEWVLSSKPFEAVYSSRSLLLPAIAVPVYLFAWLLSVDPILAIGISVNSLVITFTALVIFCFSWDLYASRRIGILLSLIYVGCSFILPYNNTLFPQPLQGLCIISSALFLYKSRHIDSSHMCTFTRGGPRNNNKRKRIAYTGIAGLLLGLSVFASPVSAFFIPAFVVCSIIYFRRNVILLVLFLVSLVIVLCFVGTVNYVRFGSVTEFGYGAAYGTFAYNQGWTGLVGLLISPGKGMIFYFPALLLLPIALKLQYRHDKGLFLLTTYILILSWIYFGTLEANGESRFWSGAIAWGPRYLIPTLPLIVIALGTLFKLYGSYKTRVMSLMKGSLVVFSVAGFAVNLPGILVWSEYGTIYAWDKERLGNHALEIMTWNPTYSPIVIHLKILGGDYISKIPVEDYRYSGWYYAAYGLAPCHYDLYILCKSGIIVLSLLGAAAIILATFFLRNRKMDFYVYS